MDLGNNLIKVPNAMKKRNVVNNAKLTDNSAELINKLNTINNKRSKSLANLIYLKLDVIKISKYSLSPIAKSTPRKTQQSRINSKVINLYEETNFDYDSSDSRSSDIFASNLTNRNTSDVSLSGVMTRTQRKNY